jgi:hypothetical protein
VRAAVTLALIVAGLVLVPILAFGAAKSRPQHGTPPPHAAHHHQPSQPAVPSMSI